MFSRFLGKIHVPIISSLKIDPKALPVSFKTPKKKNTNYRLRKKKELNLMHYNSKEQKL